MDENEDFDETGSEDERNERDERDVREESPEPMMSFVVSVLTRNNFFILLKGLSLLIEIGSIVLLFVLGFWFTGTVFYNCTLPVSEQLHYGIRIRIEKNDSISNETSGLDNDTAIATPPVSKKMRNENHIKIDRNGSNPKDITKSSDNDIFIEFTKTSVKNHVKIKTDDSESYKINFIPVNNIGFKALFSATFVMFAEGTLRLTTLIEYCKRKQRPVNDREGSYGTYFGRWILVGTVCILSDAVMCKVIRIFGHLGPESWFIHDFVFKNDYYGFHKLCLISNIFFWNDAILFEFSFMFMILADLFFPREVDESNNDD